MKKFGYSCRVFLVRSEPGLYLVSEIQTYDFLESKQEVLDYLQRSFEIENMSYSHEIKGELLHWFNIDNLFRVEARFKVVEEPEFYTINYDEFESMALEMWVDLLDVEI
jgi:hypothetical protein